MPSVTAVLLPLSFLLIFVKIPVVLPSFCFSYFVLPVSGFCLEFVRGGSTFAVSPFLWQGLRCVAGAIRGVLFHEAAAECNRCWYECEEVRNSGVQCLDSGIILMLTNDSKGGDPKAWQLLRERFNSTETAKLMNLLEKITTL